MPQSLEVRIACSDPLARVLSGLVRRQPGVSLTATGGDVVVLASAEVYEESWTGEPPKLLVVTDRDPVALRAAYRKGVRVFCDAEWLPEDLLAALQRAATGRQFVSESLLECLFAGTSNTEPTQDGHSLTAREWQVVQLVSEGHADKEIAAALGIRVTTVRSYYENACAKLCARNRAHLAARVATLLRNEGVGPPQ